MGKRGRQPQTRREVLKYGRKLGGQVVEGSSHTKVYNPETGQSVPVPRHNHLNRSLVKGIVARLNNIFFVAIVLLVPACMLIWALNYAH